VKLARVHCGKLSGLRVVDRHELDPKRGPELEPELHEHDGAHHDDCEYQPADDEPEGLHHITPWMECGSKPGADRLRLEELLRWRSHS
jgi:hypothetical protein